MATLAVPLRRMSNLRHGALASFWFGLNFHWIPIAGVLIPYQVSHLVPKSSQGTGVAVVTGVGAVFAMLLPPFVGAWSDRLTTPYGRRRPIMVAGSLLNVVGLLTLMLAPSFTVLVIGYILIQIFNNAAGAAFNGIIPDVVPPAEFGKASGVLGGMVSVGSVAGLAVTIAMSIAGHITWTYAVIAVVIVLSVLPTLWASKGEGLTPVRRRPPKPLPAAIADFLGPLRHGDFAWVIGTRLLVTAGLWTVLPFLQFFFGDVVHAAKPAEFFGYWELVVLLVGTPFGLIGGWYSDRHGRKPFVYASGAVMSVVLAIFIVLYPTSIPFVFGLGAAYGVGYGLYYAVDWALACDTLPDRERTAKDMGLFHVAFTFPQVIVPTIAGPVLDAFNRQQANSGYRVVFASGIVFFLLGTLLVSRIKSVR